jgi:flagellin
MSFQIGVSQILYNLKLINRDFETITTQLSTGKKVNSPKDDPAAWASIRRNRNEFDNYTAVNDSLNGVATSVKIADSSMNAIGKTMEEMRNSLETITGTTPPLPVGDPQRDKLIQAYNQMRDQIDQLASPSDEGAKKLLTGPDDWTISIGPNGMVRTIRAEEVHVGPTGLNIPELNTGASDVEIQQALDSLTTAKGTLQTRQQMLQLDSVAIARAQEYNGTLATAHLAQAEKAEAADTNEAAAIEKSLELRQTLSEQSLKILNDAESRILQLLA